MYRAITAYFGYSDQYTNDLLSGQRRLSTERYITIPILSENEVVAIISLSSMKGYMESTKRFLNSIQNELAQGSADF